MTKTKVHPVAELFPMMSDEEYEGLKEDIKANGQQEPVCYWRNELIDGRNRLQACQELGIKVEWWELSHDADPIPFIFSKNLHRRHLATGQRAMLAAELSNLRNGSNQHKSLDKSGKEGLPIGIPTEIAAKHANVSSQSVARAKRVIASGSEKVKQAVRDAEIKVSVAAKLVEEVPSKAEQTKLVKQGKDAVKAAVTVPKKINPGKPEKTDSPEEAAKKVKSIADQHRDKLVRAIDDYHQHKPNARERDRLVKLAQSIVLW